MPYHANISGCGPGWEALMSTLISHPCVRRASSLSVRALVRALVLTWCLCSMSWGANNPEPCPSGAYECTKDPDWTVSYNTGPSRICPTDTKAQWVLGESMTQGEKQYKVPGRSDCDGSVEKYGIRNTSYTWTITGADDSSSGSGLIANVSKLQMLPGEYTIRWYVTGEKDDSDCTGSISANGVTPSFTWDFTIDPIVVDCEEKPKLTVTQSPTDVVKACETYEGTLSVSATFENGKEKRTCGGSTTTKDITIDGEMRYSWSGNGLVEESSSSTAKVSYTEPGTYVVRCEITADYKGEDCEGEVKDAKTWTIIVDTAELTCTSTPVITVVPNQDNTKPIVADREFSGVFSVAATCTKARAAMKCDDPDQEIPDTAVEGEVTLKYAWKGPGIVGPANTPSVKIVLDKTGIHTVTCVVSGTHDVAGCDPPKQQTVSWTIDFDTGEWRCVKEPTFRVDGAPVSPIRSCDAFVDELAVNIVTTDGKEEFWLRGKKDQERIVQYDPQAWTFNWSGTGAEPPGNGARQRVDLRGEGVFKVTCKVEGVHDGFECDQGKPKDYTWSIILGWTCEREPESKNIYEESGEEPEPFVFFGVPRSFYPPNPAALFNGLEVCGEIIGIDADGNPIYQGMRTVYVGVDTIEVTCTGDGAEVRTDRFGTKYVYFTKKGTFTVSVTVTPKLLPEGFPYKCPAPPAVSQSYVVKIIPPEFWVDGDNNNGPEPDEVELPPVNDDGSDPEEPPVSAGTFALPDKSESERAKKNVMPGKIAFINNDDWDGDGIIDWDDGFTSPFIQPVLDDDGQEIDQSQVNGSATFVPAIVRIPHVGGENPERSVRVRFSTGYLGWKSRGSRWTSYDWSWIRYVRDESDWWYTYDRSVRLWTKDGNEARDFTDLADGGSRIKEGTEYTPEQLNAKRVGDYYEITLYVEARALGGTRIGMSVSSSFDSGSDAGIVSGISTTVAHASLSSFRESAIHQPVTIRGLGWDPSRAQEERAFYTWDINGEPLGDRAYILNPDKAGSPFKSLPGDKRNQKYKLGPDNLTLKLLGGNVPDPEPTDGERNTQTSYVVTIPGLAGALHEPSLQVEVGVVRPVVSVRPLPHNPSKFGRPVTAVKDGGDPSLLGIEAQVSISGVGEILKDRNRFTFTVAGDTADDVSALNFITDEANGYTMDTAMRGIRYVDGNTIAVMGQRVGGTVFRCRAVIDGETHWVDRSFTVLDVPLVVTPVAVGEVPDPRDLPTIVNNIAKRRSNRASEQTETPDNAPPQVSASILKQMTMPAQGLPTEASRVLYGLLVSALHNAGQILPQKAGWSEPFTHSQSAARFEDGTGVGGLSLDEVANAITGRTASIITLFGVLEQAAAPLDLWLREDNIVKIYQKNVDISNRRAALEVRAKHQLEMAALQRMKLTMSLVKDASQLSSGPWDDNRVLGIRNSVNPSIRGQAWYESILPISSSLEDMFNVVYAGTGIVPRPGNPYNEEVIQHMYLERVELARGIVAFLLSTIPSPQLENSNWPMAVEVKKYIGNGIFEKAIVPGVLINHFGNFEAVISDSAKALLTAQGFPVPYGEAQPLMADLKFPISGLGNMATLVVNPNAPESYRRYGQLVILTLREAYFLQEMQGETKTIAYWASFRDENPIGFTVYVIGDFFFGISDIRRLATGIDPITQQPLSASAYAMSAGMTLLNFLPGTAIIKGVQITGKVAGEAVGRKMLAGAVENMGKSSSRNATKALVDVETKATVQASSEITSRRVVGSMEQVGAAGVERSLVGGGVLSDAQRLAGAHGITGFTDASTVGKSVRRASSPGAGRYRPDPNSRSYLPVNKTLAKSAPTSGNACARLAGVEDEVAQALAKKNPEMYRWYMENACFPAGVMVRLADGTWRAIEDVRVGDRVLCRDASNPAYAVDVSRLVTEKFQRTATDLFEIHLADGTSIQGTSNHPFYSLDQGWTALQNLQPGERLLSDSGMVEVGHVRSLGHQPVAVYNLEVGDKHTYYVGMGNRSPAILVHNTCALLLWNALIEATDSGACENWKDFAKGLGLKSFKGLEEEITTMFEAWGKGRGIRAGARAKIPFALMPGLDASTGVATFARQVKASLRYILTNSEAHHLIPKAALAALEKRLFAVKSVTIGGKKYSSAVSFMVNHETNGLMLPNGTAQKAGGFHHVRHRGYHSQYNKAMEGVMIKIAEDLEADLLNAEAQQSLDLAQAAFRKAELRLRKMQKVAELSLRNKDPSNLIPLSAGRGAPQHKKDDLLFRWTKRLEQALIP